MYNILVEISTSLIKDYNRDYELFNNGVIVSSDDTIKFVYADLTSSNSIANLIDNPIEDFVGNKFMYTDGEVLENPDWEE